MKTVIIIQNGFSGEELIRVREIQRVPHVGDLMHLAPGWPAVPIKSVTFVNEHNLVDVVLSANRFTSAEWDLLVRDVRASDKE